MQLLEDLAQKCFQLWQHFLLNDPTRPSFVLQLAVLRGDIFETFMLSTEEYDEFVEGDGARTILIQEVARAEQTCLR